MFSQFLKLQCCVWSKFPRNGCCVHSAISSKNVWNSLIVCFPTKKTLLVDSQTWNILCIYMIWTGGSFSEILCMVVSSNHFFADDTTVWFLKHAHGAQCVGAWTSSFAEKKHTLQLLSFTVQTLSVSTSRHWKPSTSMCIFSQAELDYVHMAETNLAVEAFHVLHGVTSAEIEDIDMTIQEAAKALDRLKELRGLLIARKSSVIAGQSWWLFLLFGMISFKWTADCAARETCMYVWGSWVLPCPDTWRRCQAHEASHQDVCKHLMYVYREVQCIHALLGGPTSQYTSYEQGKRLKYLIIWWLRCWLWAFSQQNRANTVRNSQCSCELYLWTMQVHEEGAAARGSLA